MSVPSIALFRHNLNLKEGKEARTFVTGIILAWIRQNNQFEQRQARVFSNRSGSIYWGRFGNTTGFLSSQEYLSVFSHDTSKGTLKIELFIRTENVLIPQKTLYLQDREGSYRVANEKTFSLKQPAIICFSPIDTEQLQYEEIKAKIARGEPPFDKETKNESITLLVKLSKSGNEEAFLLLLKCYKPFLFNWTKRICGIIPFLKKDIILADLKDWFFYVLGRFNPDNESKAFFGTYLTISFRHYAKKVIKRRSNISISDRESEFCRTIFSLQESFISRNGRKPSYEELAELVNRKAAYLRLKKSHRLPPKWDAQAIELKISEELEAMRRADILFMPEEVASYLFKILETSLFDTNDKSGLSVAGQQLASPPDEMSDGRFVLETAFKYNGFIDRDNFLTRLEQLNQPRTLIEELFSNPREQRLLLKEEILHGRKTPFLQRFQDEKIRDYVSFIFDRASRFTLTEKEKADLTSYFYEEKNSEEIAADRKETSQSVRLRIKMALNKLQKGPFAKDLEICWREAA